MSTANTSRITLELEAGSDPIRGSIEHPDGSRLRFWGWLELSAQLHRVAADQPVHAARPATAGATPALEPKTQATCRQPHTLSQEES